MATSPAASGQCTGPVATMGAVLAHTQLRSPLLWGQLAPCPACGAPQRPPSDALAPADGPWETAESCVVRTSASVYRRLHESPRSPPAGMNGEESGSWDPPQPLPAPGSPQASGRLLKSESEDSGVEMASNENSPSTPLGSESSFSLDGFQQPAHGDPPKSPPGGERGAEPPRAFRSRSASRKPGQQRNRRQRQLSRRSTSAGDPRELSAEEPGAAGVRAGEQRRGEQQGGASAPTHPWSFFSPPGGRGGAGAGAAVPGAHLPDAGARGEAAAGQPAAPAASGGRPACRQRGES